MTIRITEAEYHEHTNSHDGICLACEEFTCGGVEPDATGYECEGCGERKVCGTEEALMGGEIEITE